VWVKDEARVIAHLNERHPLLLKPYIDEEFRRLIRRLEPAEVPADVNLTRGARPDAPRLGRCFQRAYEYAQQHARAGARLLHGVVFDGGQLPADHGWTEVPSRVLGIALVCDGTTEKLYDKAGWYQICSAIVDHAYSPKEAKKLARHRKNYGPWKPSTRQRMLQKALEQALTEATGAVPEE
jgi:hypothetical protein